MDPSPAPTYSADLIFVITRRSFLKNGYSR